MRVILYLAWESLKMLARQRGQLAFMVVVPISTFFTYMAIFARGKPDAVAAFLGPALALLATTHGMYGVGIDLLLMREMGMLLPYQLTPVSPTKILLSRLLVNCSCGLLLGLTEILLALIIYKIPLKVPAITLVLVVLISNFALGALGTLIFSVVNGMDEANFLAQIIFFVLFVLSGITAPLSSLPAPARVVSVFLPTTLLIKTFQGMLVSGVTIGHWWPELLVIVAFIITCTVVAVRLFRWSGAQRATPSNRRMALIAIMPLLIAGIWFNFR